LGNYIQQRCKLGGRGVWELGDKGILGNRFGMFREKIGFIMMLMLIMVNMLINIRVS
jgi:hypothetical protein